MWYHFSRSRPSTLYLWVTGSSELNPNFQMKVLVLCLNTSYTPRREQPNVAKWCNSRANNLKQKQLILGNKGKHSFGVLVLYIFNNYRVDLAGLYFTFFYMSHVMATDAQRKRRTSSFSLKCNTNYLLKNLAFVRSFTS